MTFIRWHIGLCCQNICKQCLLIHIHVYLISTQLTHCKSFYSKKSEFLIDTRWSPKLRPPPPSTPTNTQQEKKAFYLTNFKSKWILCIYTLLHVFIYRLCMRTTKWSILPSLTFLGFWHSGKWTSWYSCITMSRKTTLNIHHK